MGLFDGYLLVTDFDGTLIDSQHRISAANVAAIMDFMAEGGVFAGATGRSEANIVPFLDGLPLTWPWILYNGGAIYDFNSAAFVQRAALPQNLTAPFLRRIMAETPLVDVQIFAGGPFHRVNPVGVADPLIAQEEQLCVETPLEAMPDGWIKVLFACGDMATLERVERLLEHDPLHPLVYTTHSASRYFELTPANVNKGTALASLRAHLAARCGRPFHTVAAIGDYRNDMAMLQYADISGAPASALPEVKACAMHITASHDENAVADFINRLRGHAARS